MTDRSLQKTLAALQKAEAHLRELRAKAAAERTTLLRDVHVELGFASRRALIAALEALQGRPSERQGEAGSAEQSPAGVGAAQARPRARIGEEIRANVLAALRAGEPGKSVAQRFGISLPSLQNIKKAAGLTRSRAAAGEPWRSASPAVRARTPEHDEELALELPAEVQALFDSPGDRALRWRVPEERHAMVVEILTRGGEAAESWLWSQSSRDEVRALLRRFGGAGCDDEARELLRRKLGLTALDIPPRPFRAAPRDAVARVAH